MKTELIEENVHQWKRLEDALRAEFEEHSRLLNMLDIQESVILQDNPEALGEITKAIDFQTEVITLLREERKELVDYLARHFEIKEGNELFDLLLFAPARARTTLTALLEKSVEVLSSIQKKTRQNKSLLSSEKTRSEEALEESRMKATPDYEEPPFKEAFEEAEVAAAV